MSFCSVLLARATDYWREMLKDNTKQEIKQYNSQYDSLCTDKAAKYAHIKNASDQQTIPACFFDTHKVDSSRAAHDSQDLPGDWFFSVKEDGYLVILSRHGQNWSMQTRKGKELYPPEDFLKGLSQSKELPDVMVGELITHQNCWNENGYEDIKLRAKKRNEQFFKLQKIWWMNHLQDYEKIKERNTTKNTDAWTGLRIKIFSFPQENTYDIGQTYCQNMKIMKGAIHNHPWIGMCFMQRVPKDHPKLLIDIFTRVVQMGLEGIVLVDPDVFYANLKDGKAKNFFKLKPKHVLPKQKYKYLCEEKTDGKTEYTYETEAEGQTVRFHDQMPNIRKNESRIKYMEFAQDVNNFQCHKGIRHMHFAQDDDISMVVSAWTRGQHAADPVDKTAYDLVKEILMIGDTSRGCITRDRVFNPRGYEMCEDEDFHEAKNARRREADKAAADAVAAHKKLKAAENAGACSRPCSGNPLRQRASGGTSVDGKWVPGGNREDLCGAAPPQDMRLNPYIVDVDYMKIDKKINKKMDKLTQQLHESLRA
jgi:hypothetical protein